MNKKTFAIALIAAVMVIPVSAYADNTQFSANFVDADWIHRTQGTVSVITLEDGKNVLKFEDFKTTNGPDLYVYLATDDKATEFIDLGRLQAPSGNQEYEISDVDFSKYNKVLIWCKAFSVLFGSAELDYHLP